MTQRVSCIFETEPNAIDSRRKSTSWTFSSLTSRVNMLLTRNLFRLWENWAKTICSHRKWPLHMFCEHKLWLPTAIYVFVFFIFLCIGMAIFMTDQVCTDVPQWFGGHGFSPQAVASCSVQWFSSNLLA